MLKPLLLLYCVFIIFPITYTTDYCKICKNKSHTMCKYKKGPAKACINYKSIAMEAKIRTKIVNLHNELRNKVALGEETHGSSGPQPSATNMFVMKWDDELSKIAQRWADQCRSVTELNQHDSCKDTQRFRVGQNVMQVIRGEKPLEFESMITQIIQNWYNEVNRIDSEQISKFKGADDPKDEVGHYAQIVWATTKYIGCAHASFKEKFAQEDRIIESPVDTVVCNYGPTGNIVDASIYKVGKPCSACKCTEKYAALCEHTRLENPETKRETKREAKVDTKTETKTEANVGPNTEAKSEASKAKSSGTEPTENPTALTSVSESISEACTPHETENPHKHHHHLEGKSCPFENLRTRFRLLHREGDACYCLFRIRDAAQKMLPETYLLLFNFVLCLLFLL